MSLYAIAQWIIHVNLFHVLMAIVLLVCGICWAALAIDWLANFVESIKR